MKNQAQSATERKQGAPSEPSAQRAANAPEAPQKPVRILLVEDYGPDAELIQLELIRAKLPFTCHVVDTREGFLSGLKSFTPDLVISDYSMPQFTATEAFQLMHQQGKDLPFLLVTGSQSEETAVRVMKEGVDDYILKSSLKRLPSAVINALKKKEAERANAEAQTALERSEEHFRSLIENAMDIIAVVKQDGTLRYASPSMRALGYKTEAILGKSILSFVAPDDVREVRDVLAMTMQNPGQTRTIEFLFRHENGSWRVLEAMCKRIGSDFENAELVVNARDVTERKQAELAIEKLAAFPRLNPNPIFELDAGARVVYYNEAAEQLARMVGKEKPSELLPPDTPQIIEECLATGQNDLHRETAAGNHILSWSFFPVIPNQAVHCYALDITDRLNLEAQLRHSQKMESIGQLAAGVAHDFNNILTVVQGWTGLLLGRPDLQEDLREPLQQMNTATQRATNLTRQLLMFSRKQVVSLLDTDLNGVILDISKMLKRVLGEQILLRIFPGDNLPEVPADPGMIEQVLMNLAVNARDAMPNGGKLTVSTSTVRINKTHVKINPEASEGEFVCLRVNDTGQGMSTKVMSKIFEPFFTTKEVGKGTGLGLATVYGIVKQHKGWIEVLSREKMGTTFHVFLPVSNKPKQVAEPMPEQIETPLRGGSETIFLVEDEPDLRSMVKEILENYGYNVFTAASGPEAIPVWQEHAGRIDLLLTDMVMPGAMTGRDLAERFLQERPELKVVYTSGYSVDTASDDEYFQRGVNFLPKPYNPQALVRIVRQALDSRTQD